MALSLPHTLTAGTPEDVGDVQENDAYLATQIDATNTQLEYAYSTYKTIMPWIGGGNGTALTASTRMLMHSSFEANYSSAGVFYFDPADYTAGSRTNKYRLRTVLWTNQVAPTINFNVGLYPMTLSAGASGAGNTFTAGAIVASSNISYATPSASTASPSNSSDFTAPAAGYYAILVIVGGSAAAGANIDLRASIQMRQV